jgi:photosystem II stability/assembly factor-like uncharacterized protein
MDKGKGHEQSSLADECLDAGVLFQWRVSLFSLELALAEETYMQSNMVGVGGRYVLLSALVVTINVSGSLEAGINSWSSIGPYVASINSLAIDPSAPNALYVGTPAGIFKTTNSGGPWNKLNTSLANFGLPHTGVTALAIDRTTPATVSAGTSVIGIIESTNGGESWNAINSGLIQSTVSVMAVDPATPTMLYAATSGGVFKSTNGGDNWISVNSLILGELVIDPVTPTTLYGGTNVGVFKSTNAGQTGAQLTAA